jgi:RNA polymerase sigma factor (sigma-70 family)
MEPETSNTPADLADEAFQQHSAELRRFLLRRVKNRDDADDLAQEVFARLLRVKDAELVRKPMAYLIGIATHVVREFRQRRQLEPVLFDSHVSDSVPEESRLEGPQMDEQLDLQARLDAAIAKLPPAHQVVLILVKRDGLSYTEAAKKARLSVHTVEKYLVEARAQLRMLLRQD